MLFITPRVFQATFNVLNELFRFASQGGFHAHSTKLAATNGLITLLKASIDIESAPDTVNSAPSAISISFLLICIEKF